MSVKLEEYIVNALDEKDYRLTMTVARRVCWGRQPIQHTSLVPSSGFLKIESIF